MVENNTMKKIFSKVGLIGFILLVSVSLFASAKADSFYPDFEKDKDMSEVSKGLSGKNRGIQFGGWITPILIDVRGNDSSSLFTTDTIKIWTKYYLTDNLFLYGRIKNTISKTVAGFGSEEKLDNLFDLDFLYFKYISSSKNLSFSAGRKHFLVGTGIVLNGRGDGAEINYFSKIVKAKIFGSYTGLLRADNNPYNIQDGTVTYEGKKIFTGAVIEKDIENHTAYLFGVAQIDLAEESIGTKSKYNSQYYGVGVKGLAIDGLSYYGEFVYEMGNSYAGGITKSDISAMSTLFGADYYFKSKLKPYVTIQYAYASGDEDRDGSISPIGNVSGADNAFISYGVYSGGYALRPNFSNIHVARLGGGISPFANSSINLLKRATFLGKYSAYIIDSSKDYVGDGFDLSLRWKIFSDFSFFATSAIYIPRDEYPSGTGNSYFNMIGMNLSF